MTIRRGQEWGETVRRPADLVVADGDAALARLVATDATAHYGLGAGDLFRSLGAPAQREVVQRLPVDALVVTVGDREMIGVAHVVARRSWWRGQVLAVMNADHLGQWNVAPRAHPNDGRADVVEVDPTMSLRHRWQARGRLPHGTHVPHPKVHVRTAAHGEWTFARPMRVWVDGIDVGRCTRLAVRVSADHFEIHV